MEKLNGFMFHFKLQKLIDSIIPLLNKLTEIVNDNTDLFIKFDLTHIKSIIDKYNQLNGIVGSNVDSSINVDCSASSSINNKSNESNEDDNVESKKKSIRDIKEIKDIDKDYVYVERDDEYQDEDDRQEYELISKSEKYLIKSKRLENNPFFLKDFLRKDV